MAASIAQASYRGTARTAASRACLRWASSSSSPTLTNDAPRKSNAPPPASPAQPAAAKPAKPPPSRLLKGVANLLGYNSARTMAVRSTNYYYNMLSEQHRVDWDFWYGECRLQQSFQAWFQITNLYIYFLTVRFRALNKPLGRDFLQQMVNHFFIDAEYRMQSDYEIKQSRYIKNTLKTMLAQYHGSTLAYDEALVGSDAMLAAAIWRNVFGTGWGVGMAGVEGAKPPKVAPLGKSEGPKFEAEGAEAAAIGADVPADPILLDPAAVVEREASFAMTLEKLVRFVRYEVHRLDQLPDEVIMNGPALGRPDAIHFVRLTPPPPPPPAEPTTADVTPP